MAEDALLVLTTGGTIDKLYFDALSEFQVGESIIHTVMTVARVSAPFRVVELMRKDSLEMDEDDRRAILAAVEQAREHRVIITHGTDTMEQTAKALAGVTGKTIVLAGALSPARFRDSDAVFNLGMAVAAAQLAGEGVWIVMNGTVFAGGNVRKDRQLGAFVPIE